MTDISKQVAWMSKSVRQGLIELDFSMLDYQEDAYPYCAAHPSDVSSEADLTDLGRECRAHLMAAQKVEPMTAYEIEAMEW